KFHRLETMAFIEGTRRSVRLMRMEFEPGRGYLLGNIDQLCAPAFAPFTWINVESVNIRCLHGEIGDDLVIEDANPDCALHSNDGVKNKLRPLNSQCLPCRKIWVRSQSRAVPHAHHFSLVGIVKRSNAAACLSYARVVHNHIASLIPHTR